MTSSQQLQVNTMSQPYITNGRMTEILQECALKICQLSLKITTQGIAQAWAEVHGHVNVFYAVIRPIDATIPDDDSPRPELAELRISLGHRNFHTKEQAEESFRERLSDASRYIAYLELLLARGKAVTVAAMRGAA